MASFDKSSVDVAELSSDELSRVVGLLGIPYVSPKKLCDGACAANYVVGSSVVKAVVGPEAEELARQQMAVLAKVKRPSLTSQVAVPCVTSKGLKACAIAMQLVPGSPISSLVREGKLDPVEGFGALGDCLGRLHASGVAAPVDAVNVGDSGFMERFLRLETTVEAELDSRLDDEFVKWLSDGDWRRLREARKALDNSETESLPKGLLHCDPYPDNALAVVSDDEKKVSAVTLVDWEDASFGPYCYDVACSLAATAFNGTEIRTDVASGLLTRYSRVRPFSDEEAAALPSLISANALACALYRWHQFHVVIQDAPDEAKTSHLEMKNVVTALEDSVARNTLRQMATATVGQSPP